MAGNTLGWSEHTRKAPIVAYCTAAFDRSEAVSSIVTLHQVSDAETTPEEQAESRLGGLVKVIAYEMEGQGKHTCEAVVDLPSGERCRMLIARLEPPREPESA